MLLLAGFRDSGPDLGAGFLPLTVPAACPGFLARGPGFGWPCGVAGSDRSGWSGSCGGRPAGAIEEAEPLVLAVPAVGQVEGNVAASVAGGAGGDRDQVAADGRGPGLREGQAGQGAGRAQQVVRHGRDRQPRGVRREIA